MRIAPSELEPALVRDAIERRFRSAPGRPLWVRVGQLLDGVSDAPCLGANIVFDPVRIHYVGTDEALPADFVVPGLSAPDLNLPHYTLLPGLIDAHAHLFLDGAPIDFEARRQYLERPHSWLLERARSRWTPILSCGVTAVRDAGDKAGVGLALAREAKLNQDGIHLTPWIDSPGAAIYHRGRYGSFLGHPIEEAGSLAECVMARVATGAGRIKLIATGIINFKVGQVTSSPQLSAAEVAAIVEAAGQHHRQTFAHASGADGIENVIDGGVTTVEHGFFITRDQLAKMRDRQIGWVPTFAPVEAQIDHAEELRWDDRVVVNLKRIIDQHRRMLTLAHEMGVNIIAGSDAGSCGVPHGVGLLTELECMEQAGMAPIDVINSATGMSASVLDFPEPIGRLASGCRSRMILTPHDPLRAVSNLQKEKIVLFDGRALHRNDGIQTEGL